MLSFMDELRAARLEWMALENYMAIHRQRPEIPFERNVIEQVMWQTFRMPYDERIWSEYKALMAAVDSMLKALLAGAASVLRLLHNHGAQARRNSRRTPLIAGMGHGFFSAVKPDLRNAP